MTTAVFGICHRSLPISIFQEKPFKLRIMPVSCLTKSSNLESYFICGRGLPYQNVGAERITELHFCINLESLGLRSRGQHSHILSSLSSWLGDGCAHMACLHDRCGGGGEMFYRVFPSSSCEDASSIIREWLFKPYLTPVISIKALH